MKQLELNLSCLRIVIIFLFYFLNRARERKMKVLLLGDIANRWAVSVERVQELIQIDPLFPRPYIILPSKDNLYLETDINEYEQLHVELAQVYIRGRNLRAFLRGE
ncbi:hypothetical protein CN307_06060 [Bacillus cereus]|uniref:Uncharacterized protein n=2 Tax=Bacillaceae TaxID=186817 RepID=A0A2A9A3Y4_BACCE|nr:hypothetical protein CN307_06060 [Bacillus cereus]